MGGWLTLADLHLRQVDRVAEGAPVETGTDILVLPYSTGEITGLRTGEAGGAAFRSIDRPANTPQP